MCLLYQGLSPRSSAPRIKMKCFFVSPCPEYLVISPVTICRQSHSKVFTCEYVNTKLTSVKASERRGYDNQIYPGDTEH